MFGFDPECFTIDGDLTINGVEMMTPAWVVVDILDLLSPLNAIRGSDIVIPTVTGRRNFPRRRDEAVYSLRMACTGQVDISGTPYSNTNVGLRINLEYLRDNVVLPSLIAPVPGVITLPDSGTRSADVIVTSFKLGERTGPIVLAVMELTVPAGFFT